MQLAKTTRYTRHTYGDDGQFGKRNIVSVSFSATDLGKATPANATSILASTAGAVVAAPTAQPSVPRNLQVTTTGAGTVIVTGRNVEGAVITENFVAASATVVVGAKAFASVTSVNIPGGISASVGVGVLFGVNQRIANNASVKVLLINADKTTTFGNTSAQTANATVVENNVVTPNVTLDGTKQVRVYVLNYNWHVDPINAQPDYGA